MQSLSNTYRHDPLEYVPDQDLSGIQSTRNPHVLSVKP